MRDEVYREFSLKIKPIIKDCMVTENMISTNPEKYTLHIMSFFPNKGSVLFFDREKVTKKYSEDIKNLFSILPQKNSPLSVREKLVDSTTLVSNSTLSEQDKTKKAKLLKSQGNIIESFFVFAEEINLGILDSRAKYPIFHLKEKIPTKYTETPGDTKSER